jgi:hypothetical protein
MIARLLLLLLLVVVVPMPMVATMVRWLRRQLQAQAQVK